MLYDDYRKKMNKLKNVLDTVKRFRVLIIIVCAALIALIVTLMSVSGIVYDKTDCPATLTYGEELDYRAKAVFKSVSYEYAEENSDKWTYEKPVRAGSYKVRPVSKSVFGGKRYGKIHSFEILRRQTDISAALQTVYGDDPEVVADLAFSDKAVCTRFDFDDLTAKTTSVIPELSGVKILDENGNDVTSSYVLKPVQTQITFIPRPITVKADDAEKVYDGTPLTCETYSDAEGKLLSGHTLSAVTKGSQTDARVKGVNSIAEGSVKITDANGADVTHNYYIMTEVGTLEVTPRPVRISTGSAEKVYDGTPLVCGTYSAENLVKGHSLFTLTYDGKISAGVTFNSIKEESVKITDTNGDDVTANYDIENIEYSLGTLTVTKRRLTVTADDGKFVYDGTARQSAAHTTENLVAGQRTQGKASVSLTEVGTVKNRVTVTVFSGAEDVTANYDISYIDGYLTVAPRAITLSAGSVSEEYDGKAHTCGAYDVTSSFSSALVSGHKINADTQGSQTDIGTGANRIVAGSVKITNANGNPVTGNYDITIADGEIRVTARIITVKADDAQKIYDGTPLTCSTVKDVNGKLLSGHTLSAVTKGSQTDADKAVNSIAEGSVKITDANGADVTRYYSVNTEDGTLEVKPRPIKINSGSAEKVYDGTPLSCDEYNITSDYSPALVLSHEARISYLIKCTYVIEDLPNVIKIEIYDGTTKVTSNYFIDYEDDSQFGTLTITPRPITVTTKGGEWVYDGKEHYNTDIIISGSGLVDGQSYSVDYYTVIVNAGETDNRISIKVYSEKGIERTNNYAITYAKPYGILKVTKRPLIVVACSAEKVYDGTQLSCPDAVADNLVQGHVLSVVTVGNQTNVGTSNNYISSVQITVDDNGLIRDVTKNYDIKFVNGTLTVTPRPVTVYALDASKIFDGAPLTCPKYGWVNLVQNHRVSAKVTGVQIAVGSSPNAISDIAIYNGYRNVTSNYEITAKDGTLTVTQGKIIIFTGSAQKQYDGTPLTCPLYYIDENSVIPQGFTYTVNVTGTITDVGVKPNTFKITVFDAEGNDVTENIEIERQLGLLKVFNEEDESGGIGGGGLDGSGGIGGSGSSGTLNKPSVMMKLYSDTVGDAYLRYKSFGDYNGKNWTEAQAYALLINGGYSANYLTAFALANSGVQSHELQILPFTFDYTLPYYAAAEGGSYSVQSSDTTYNGNTGAQYSINYYSYDYASQANAQYAVPSQYADYESSYRQFVYQNYLSVPSATREYLNGIISTQRFNRNDSQIVAKVARYVQRSAKYNLNYNSALDSSSDIVVAFLRDYKEGICSHYASAATLMFRTLGIPARYTIGYKGATSANEWTDVTSDQAHAWVEVYIDGTGWVYVEVTGSAGGNEGGETGDGSSTGEGIVNDYTIVLRPKNEAKVYDGTPVYAKELVPDAVLEKLLEMGYTYTVTFGGSLSYHGTASSEVTSFTLFDADGNNVTDKFKYKYVQGKLTVAYNLVTVCLYNLAKEYDGTSLRYSSGEYYATGLPQGYSLIFDPSGIGRTDAGVIYADDLGKASVYVLDRYGMNVTSQFYVHFEGALVITQRTVKLTAGSDEKVYDGEALTNGSYFISGGSLVVGHSVQANVAGSITDIGAAPNKILSADFYDADGKKVSLNYFCIGYAGTLRVHSD
ncbi:MAG: transglutaminase-like domain-containing protein [Clostridia bacterium]|nr:transglutaminase-like domain-containing protein [Clostridia bacterium]